MVHIDKNMMQSLLIKRYKVLTSEHKDIDFYMAPTTNQLLYLLKDYVCNLH